MVRIIKHSVPGDCLRVEILSNLSMTLDQLAAFFLALSAVTLTMALLPTLMGYWPVLVIAVVHLVFVGWCFRLAWRGNWARQRIEIGPEITLIEQTALRQRHRSEWPTVWLQVTVENAGHEPRVFIGSHGRRQEIAQFVPAGERLEAAEILESGLRRHSAWNSALRTGH